MAGPKKIFEEEQRLRTRLTELAPAIAEARRIRRRLKALSELAREERSRLPSYRPTNKRFAEILNLLEARPGIRRKDVAEALGIGQARAGQITNLMIRDDLVSDLGRRGLRLTRLGTEALREGVLPTPDDDAR